ncbi:MbtH family protein [Actinoplanes sp. NPDC051470]|uniref:MbtH family protein n=1 Tax=unclassified Actinoplanes TaxID=2626549 RepID=UPI003428B7D0
MTSTVNTENDQERTYKVVLNEEEQYSIWPDDREIPTGWRPSGFTGGKDDCLQHIDQVWTDITPLSVRRRLADTR